MTTRKNAAVIAGITVIALLGTAYPAVRSAKPAPARIYVVAIHDSSLFTLCPPELRTALVSGDFRRINKLPNYEGNVYGFIRYSVYMHSDGKWVINSALGPTHPLDREARPLIVPPPYFPRDSGILERARPNWGELSALIAGVCPSGWLDPLMRKEIEAEFRKEKAYELVDSAEKADFVFLVEGLYYTYWAPEGGGRMNYFATDSGPIFGQQLRQAAIAVVVPSEVYRRDPVDCAAFLRAGTWAGATVWQGATPYQSISAGVDPYLSTRSASIKDLVARFFKKSKWPADLPTICPAWSIQPTGAPGAVSSRRPQSVGDSGSLIRSAEGIGQIPSANVIRTETVLVTVPVIASDANGRYIPDLTLKDFRLFENGIEQKIERLIDESAPFRTALMMDTSRSTGFVRSDIESAGLTFLESLRPEDELMALSLSNVIYVDSEFTGDRGRLRSGIKNAVARAGIPYSGPDKARKQQWDKTEYVGTRLYDAVDLTVTERLNQVTGRKAMLLFTDGVDTGSRLATAPSTLARIEESDVLVYVIKYDTPMPKTKYRNAAAGAAAAYSQGAQYLQELASNSGGRLFNASKGADLPLAFSAIAEELRHQYTLCYYPTGPLDSGSFRRIQVTTARDGVKVRARPGYQVNRKVPKEP